jgi:hypothetical protein
MTPEPPTQAELERQRANIEAIFRTGWVPEGVGQPRTLTAAEYTEARKLITEAVSRLSHLEPAIVQAVREGARPGGRAAARERKPFITGVSDDVEVLISHGAVQYVAVLFSHDSFPGVLFGHRFTAPSDKHAEIWLMEEIETGALHRMMRVPPWADDEGIIWTAWGVAPSAP